MRIALPQLRAREARVTVAAQCRLLRELRHARVRGGCWADLVGGQHGRVGSVGLDRATLTRALLLHRLSERDLTAIPDGTNATPKASNHQRLRRTADGVTARRRAVRTEPRRGSKRRAACSNSSAASRSSFERADRRSQRAPASTPGSNGLQTDTSSEPEAGSSSVRRRRGTGCHELV